MKVLYIFKNSSENIKLAEQELFPKLFYGYFETKKSLQVDYIDMIKKQGIISRIISRFYKNNQFDIGLLNSYDIIYATTDGIAIELAKLKKENKLKVKVVANIMSIVDNKIQNKYIDLLYELDGIICFSQKIQQYLDNYGLINTHFIEFGIDTKYYYPISDIANDNTILSIGLDNCRDWETLIKVAKKLPKIKFKVVTHDKNKYLFNDIKNIIFLGNIPLSETRLEIAKSRFVFLPTKNNYYFSGQTTLFNVLAMKKYVLMPYDQNFSGYDFNINMFYESNITLDKLIKVIEKVHFNTEESILKENHLQVINLYNEKEFGNKIINFINENNEDIR